jgi:large subunit ribosomal protein L24
MGPKHENEVPLPMDHVRLVIPSEVIEKKKEGDAIVDAIVYKDVIVEKIFMERHTTGIDPYTGTDYGDAEIPEEHQHDPRNGSPIFHRYIAGTQHRLKWPWEREEDVRDVGKTEEDNTDNQTRLRKVGSAVAAPWQSLKRWRESRNKEARTVAVKAKSTSKEFSNIEEADALEDKKAIPRAKDSDAPEAYDGVDTTRNVVFDAESVAYTLVAPPFPDTLGEELRGHIHDFSIQAKKEASKDPDAPRFVKTNAYSEKSLSTMQKVREATRQRLRAAQAMKTPMQLRWELAQRSKAERMKKSPLVDEESLLVALGGHMAKKSGKPYLGKKEFGSQTADLD